MWVIYSCNQLIHSRKFKQREYHKIYDLDKKKRKSRLVLRDIHYQWLCSMKSFQQVVPYRYIKWTPERTMRRRMIWFKSILHSWSCHPLIPVWRSRKGWIHCKTETEELWVIKSVRNFEAYGAVNNYLVKLMTLIVNLVLCSASLQPT